VRGITVASWPLKLGTMNRVEKADIFEANVLLYQQLMEEPLRIEEEREQQ
jgi:hypothetical protein